MSWREKFLLRTAQIACKHYRAVLIVAILITALAIIVMCRQGYSSSFNVARILPQNIPAARIFTQSLTNFGTVDEAVLVFWLNPDDPRSVINTGNFADRIVAKLQNEPEFSNVFCKLLTDAEKAQLINVELPHHGMLLLTPDDLAQVKEKLTADAMTRSIDNTVRKLTTLDAESPAGEAVLLNALGLAEIFQNRLENLLGKKNDSAPEDQPSAEPKKIDSKGYLVSPDGRMLLLIAQPRQPAQNVRFARRVMELLENTVYETIVGAEAFPATADSALIYKSILTSAAFADFRKKIGEKEIAKLARLGSDSNAPEFSTDDLRLIAQEINEILRRSDYLPKDIQQAAARKIHELRSFGLNKEILTRAVFLAFGRDYLRQIFHNSGNDLIPPNPAPLPVGALKNIQVEFAGGYQISRRYAASVNNVMLSTLALSALLVLGFFGWCFHRVGVFVYIGVPLLMIISWTGGIGWALFGQLNLISCSFAAVLVGLGVDYAVHIYNRYIEERGHGANVETAFTTAILQTGWGVIIGMITTCAAFAALLSSRFEHLAEFGALGALGILLSAPVMMFVMPALITLRNHYRPENLRIFAPSEFYLPRLVNFIERYRRAIFVGGLTSIFIALVFICLPGKLNFDTSMAALRPRDRAFEINGEIARAFSTRNPNKLSLIVSAPTEAEALEKTAQFKPKLAELEKRGLIVGYESVTQFLPPPSRQRELLAQIRDLHLDESLATLQKILAQKNLDPSYFAFNIRLLKQHAELAAQDKIILPSDFKQSKIARMLETLVAQRRKEMHLGEGVPAAMKFPITLARAAVTNETDRVLYPAGAVLTREQVRGLIPKTEETDKVYSLAYYDDSFAVKTAIFPPVASTSRDGEPALTHAWLDEVGTILGLDTGQFAAVADNRDYAAVLTGVPIASLILANIVKEDFLRISICVVLICLMTINLFFTEHWLRALLTTLPLAIFGLGEFLYPTAPWFALTGYVTLSILFLFGALWHRQIHQVSYCFLPVTAGIIYLFGFMALLNCLGQKFFGGNILDLNFVNVLTIPIIIGVGVDNGIHLTQRYYESNRDLRLMVINTGRALAITELTSMVGFGSLFLAKFQGLDSVAQLGVLSTLALAMGLIASLLVFPALIASWSPKSK